MTVECTECDRDDFDTERAMKIHRANLHDVYSRVTLECERCGDEYEVTESEQERSKYCCKDCKMAALYDGREDSRITVECDYCGSDVKKYEREIRDTNFCDHECHGEWLSGENHHNWRGGKVTVECSACGEELERWPSQADYEHHFCYDKGCRYDWISENLCGENHASWKGGTSFTYQGDWQNIRKDIRERDDYQCRICGMDQETHIEETGTKLPVHHITPVRKFENHSDAHFNENLVTVCRSCHGKWEGVPVFPKNHKK